MTHQPVKVDITDSMKQIADRVEMHFSKLFKNGGNYTGLEEDKRFYYGILGELTFYTYLKSLGKKMKFIHDFIRPDGGDFTVYENGLAHTLDIKTCSKAFHKYVAIPKVQFDKYTSDYYVGIKIDGNTATIMGYCNKANLEELPVPPLKVPSMGQYLDLLNPISELTKVLEDGEIIAMLPDWCLR